MAEKLDLTKQFKHLYLPSAKAPVIVDVPPMNFLMIDGRGDPNTTPAYSAAVEGLYSLAYTLKFAFKKAEGLDFAVPPLEGLWWAEDMTVFTTSTARDAWQWTMMIALPEPVTGEWVERARSEAVKKKGLPVLEHIRVETYHEGRAAQIMHIGPYAAEGPTISGLHAFIQAQGLHLHGKHHEIYLSDPRRTAPEKMRTVIRQPVKD